ncbi:hypothetical protein BC830DRAFT_1226051 [Chytriomyces sp. MP71]|nr:hypothetical protein BC830DRAFT_1226051 [Chytriomyces sp. MP71]
MGDQVGARSLAVSDADSSDDDDDDDDRRRSRNRRKKGDGEGGCEELTEKKTCPLLVRVFVATGVYKDVVDLAAGRAKDREHYLYACFKAIFPELQPSATTGGPTSSSLPRYRRDTRAGDRDRAGSRGITYKSKEIGVLSNLHKRVSDEHVTLERAGVKRESVSITGAVAAAASGLGALSGAGIEAHLGARRPLLGGREFREPTYMLRGTIIGRPQSNGVGRYFREDRGGGLRCGNPFRPLKSRLHTEAPCTMVNSIPMEGADSIVPFVRFTVEVVRAALAFARVGVEDEKEGCQEEVVVDLGCGDGRVLEQALLLSSSAVIAASAPS